MFRDIQRLLLGAGLLLLSGCTNHLYQAEMTGPDSYGKERHFVMYWTKTVPLLGLTKATPATLVTECTPGGIELTDQPEGIVFKGIPGKDRLPGPIKTIPPDQICGRVTNYSSLVEPGPGPLYLLIFCEPSDGSQFAPAPRNYPLARKDPYLFTVKELKRHWNWKREDFAAPAPPPCTGTGK